MIDEEPIHWECEGCGATGYDIVPPTTNHEGKELCQKCLEEIQDAETDDQE